ncbi:uncharacterized protein [Centruroides vittatus]|uniref:uncharacterized protein isoform X2 n=1 Tax=Centruroides vittatus TaxID=120091 RepID=UPI00350FA6FC
MNMNTSLVFLLVLAISVICEGRSTEDTPDKVRSPGLGREEASLEVGQDANLASSAEKKSVKNERVKGMLHELEKKIKPNRKDVRENAEESVMPSKHQMKQRLRKQKEQMHSADTEKYGRKVVHDADEKLLAVHNRKRSQKKDSEEVKAIRELEEKMRALHAEGRSDDDDAKELHKQLVALRKKILRDSIKDDTVNKNNEKMKKLLEERKARRSNIESRQAQFSIGNQAKKGKHVGQMKKPNRNQINSPNQVKPIMANLG